MSEIQKNRRRPQVTVVGNSEAGPVAEQAAFLIGKELGRLGCTIISGGGGGIMHAASAGAASAGALTVGILPGDDVALGNTMLDVVIPTGVGFARNAINVLAADVVVAIGGGAGTLSEIAYAWMYHRPIVALTGVGGWSERLAGEAVDDKHKGTVLRADSVQQVMCEVEQLLEAQGLIAK